MTPSTDKARLAFQEQLDWTMDDETLTLDLPRERPGPVVIRNRIILDGKGCTLWAQAGPVLSVLSEKVVLRNLRIEFTADGADEGPHAGVALLSDGAGLTLEGVTVRGTVKGLVAEEGEWRYPHQLNLGALAYGMAHTVRVRVVVPVQCQITSEISGLSIEPRMLKPGAHEIRIEIEEMMRDTLVSGTIGIKTKFLRREIVLNAHILSPAVGLPEPARDQDRLVWQPNDWAEFSKNGVQLAPPPPTEPVSLAPPVPLAPLGPVAPPVSASKDWQPEPIALVPAPPVIPVVAPIPNRKKRPISGPLLGDLFRSPPVVNPSKPLETPDPVAELPTPEPAAEPPSPPVMKPATPPVVRPKSGLFSPPAPRPEPVPQPLPEAALSPPEPEPPVVSSPPAPPVKMKFKPIGGLQPRLPVSPPPEPPPAGETATS